MATPTSKYDLENRGENENGVFWHAAEVGVTVFEDVQEGAPRFYAWVGGFEDHDTAEQTGVFATADEAIDAAVAAETRKARSVS